jgi:glycosyltransferase involved in cell wall biosynthesis
MAATLSRFCHVDLISGCREFTLETMAAAFNLDLSRVTERIAPDLTDDGFEIPGKSGALEQIKRSRTLTDSYDLFIYCGHGVPPFCAGKRGLVYCHFPRHAAPRIELGGSAEWAHRSRLDRKARGAAYNFLWRIRMRPYKAVLTNSSFTAQWIERYWGMAAEVVYSPVGGEARKSSKRNMIVSLGRFDGCFRRSKQQLAQVGAFRDFLAKVGGDWMLCLVGSCYTPEEKAYLAAVQHAAEGLPVGFMINADRETVSRTLGEAKLFWHTQGLGSDDRQYPWEAEHFGVATVEAMRAGCVPIVIASGGQKEIIEQGASGFLCQDLAELIEKSASLARNENLLPTLSEQARRRSMLFTKEAFDARVMRIVSRYLPN